MGAASAAAGRLRILLTVHHHLERGSGAPGSTLVLAEELERRGHAVEVVGLGLLRAPLRGTAASLAFPHVLGRVVRRRLDRGDLDVIDASTGDLAHVSPASIRTSSAAVFTRSHGLEALGVRARREGAAAGELSLRRRYRLYHGGLRLREVAASMRAADAVLVLNDAEAAYALDELGIDAARIWRTAPAHLGASAVLDRAPSRDVLVLGDATWRKGGDVASRVVESVLRCSPDATASWAGLSAPDALGAELGADVRGRVEVSGRYGSAQLAGLLADHRVLLFASRFEGLPVTLLEALNSGIAVVGADVPGVRDLLAGGAGVLVPPGHVEGFTGATLSLLGDHAARAACGAAGRAVAGRLALGGVVDRLVDAYRCVLAIKRAE